MSPAGTATSSAATTTRPTKRRRSSESGQREIPSDPEPWRQSVYTRLDPASKQIRLLKLHPSRSIRDDPICVLYTASLNQARFSAVSYVWGDRKYQKQMTLNGHQIRVGRNAHSALRYIRGSEVEQVVWMDALCINQQDTAERSQQVSLMGGIFSRAQPVWLWTGKYTQEAKTFMQIMRGMSFMRDESITDLDLDSPDTEAFMDLTRDQWMSLSAVLANRFWQRVWILQEVIMSAVRNQAIILFGPCRMDYNTFNKAVRAILKVATVEMTLANDEVDAVVRRVLKDGHIFLNHLILKDANGEGTIGAIRLLDCSAKLQATNPRDCVYGLLGLVPETSICPDYEKSVSEVYQDATVEVIRMTGSLDTLIHCDFVRQSLNDLPSWTLNWQCDTATQATSKSFSYIKSDLYNACAGSTLLLSRKERRLFVRGHKLLSIERLAPYNIDYATGQSLINLAAIRNWTREQHILLCEGRSEDFEDAFKRTLLLDEVTSQKYNTSVRLGRLERLTQLQPLQPVEIFFNLMDCAATGHIPNQAEEDDMQWLRMQIVPHLPGAKFTVDRLGRLYLLHPEAQTGDSIFVLSGGSVPFVLRPVTGETVLYRMIGPCYVHGAMDGEAVIDSPKRVSTGDPDAFDNAFENIVLV